MAVSAKTVQLVKTVLTPFRDAGAVPAVEYDEMFSIIARQGKTEPTKATMLVSRKAGAAMLGISARSLDRLLRDGTLRPIRVGKRSIRLNLAELSNFMSIPQQINPVAQPLVDCQTQKQ